MVEFTGGDADGFWSAIMEEALDGGYSGESPLIVWKEQEVGGSVPHPSLAVTVLVQNVGELKGQVADWRGSFADLAEGFHAVEFDDRYECHLDSKDPFKDPLGHLAVDSPGTLAMIGVGVAFGVAILLAVALSGEG